MNARCRHMSDASHLSDFSQPGMQQQLMGNQIARPGRNSAVHSSSNVGDELQGKVARLLLLSLQGA